MATLQSRVKRLSPGAVWAGNLFWTVVAVGLLLGATFVLNQMVEANPAFNYWNRIVVLSGIYITLAVSLNLINGITGQFSLGHAGFFGIGAYLGAGASLFFTMPALYGPQWQRVASSGEFGPSGLIVMLVAILAGGLAAGIAGYLVGLPTLRLRGDYLAIATLGFGEIIRVVFNNAELFNAQRGLGNIPQLADFFWVALIAVACVAFCRNLLTSVHGLGFLAVREDEVAAGAMGINTTRYKVIAFVIGATFAGMAGAAFAHYEGFIEPDSFRMDISIMVVTMVVLGGQGSVTGSIIAAIALTALPELLRFTKVPGTNYSLADLRMVLFSLVLILMMLYRPQGIFGHHEWSLNRLFRRLLKRKADA